MDSRKPSFDRKHNNGDKLQETQHQSQALSTHREITPIYNVTNTHIIDPRIAWPRALDILMGKRGIFGTGGSSSQHWDISSIASTAIHKKIEPPPMQAKNTSSHFSDGTNTPANYHNSDQQEFIVQQKIAEEKELTPEITIRERQPFEKLCTDTHELMQYIHESNTYWVETFSYSADQTLENYSPFYSMKSAENKERFQIDSTRRNAVGIRGTRRIFYLLGENIQTVATEQKVAQLTNHSEDTGARMSDLQKVFEHFNINYSLVRGEELTIDDLKKVTQYGYPILTHVFKEKIGGSVVVIEGMSENGNNEPICTIYDPYYPDDQRILDIPYKELQPLFRIKYYILPTNWQDLHENVPKPTFIRESQSLLAQHQTIHEESQQALDDYQQLKNNSQKYQQKQQEIKEVRDLLLEKLHKARNDLTIPNKSETQALSTIDLQKLEEEINQHKAGYQSEIQEIKQILANYQQPQRNPDEYTQEQKDNICIQRERLLSLCTKSEQLHKKISKALNIDTPFTIKIQLQQTLTPEDTIYIQQKKIEALYSKLKKIYEKMPNNPPTASEEQEYKQLRNKIEQSIKTSNQLIKEFSKFIKPEIYNPYYPINIAEYVEAVNIHFTRYNPCGPLTIMRVLSLRGKDISREANEQEIAQLTIHFENAGITFGQMQRAFKYFHIDTSYTYGTLTIDDIKHIIGHRHFIVMFVKGKKESFGDHFLLIEEISKANNGEHVCTIFDPYNLKRWKISYKNLEAISTDQYLTIRN